MNSNYRSVYIAFDPYPSYKGSAIHIEKASGVLSKKFGPSLLLTLSGHTDQVPVKNIFHQQADIEESNFLRRAFTFSKWVDQVLDKQYNLSVGHFRDIWGGMSIIKRPHITSVFEVNGLPSIELINRYPYLPKDTIQKIRAIEDGCLQKANVIVCPSEIIKNHLIQRGTLEEKIQVISNGADLPDTYSKLDDLPEKYIVYFGALQPWQGVDVLLKAFQYLRDKPDLHLVICSSHKEKFSRPYKKLVTKLEIEQQVIWKHQLHKDILHQIIQHAICTVAPLTECSRNLEQGCSPLKIFESMACNTPVIAADLPVIREILDEEREVRFFQPERPAELARQIRILTDYPDVAQSLAQNAFKKFQKNYTWDKIDLQLDKFYTNLLAKAY